MFVLDFAKSRRPRRPRSFGPIFIEDATVRLNVVDGFATSRRPYVRRPPYPQPRSCAFCGERFEAKNGNHRFCSLACRDEHAAERAAIREVEAMRLRRRKR